jgi:hypothetical protein
MRRVASVLALVLITVVGIAVLGFIGTASAADYRFAVRAMNMEVQVRPDASAHIRYEITFDNQHGARPIDIVDIGLPHSGYDRASAKAWIDGQSLGTIRASEVVDPGLEAHLGARAIRPGQTGTFAFEIVVPDLVYSDTTDETQASFRITPTWFDSSLLVGSGELTIGVWLPEGVDPSRVFHHGTHGNAEYRIGEHEGRIVAAWHFGSTRVDRAHLVGVSFPREVMDRVVELTKLDLLLLWWELNLDVRIAAFVILLGVMAVFFFRFSAGTGFSVFAFGAVGVGLLYFMQPSIHLFTMPLWLVLGVWMERKVRRVRKTYLPPIVSVEGGGIKRGLTAPEAAVLLEMPLGRVLTLTVFGMLKKGLLVAVEHEPLFLRVRSELDVKDRGKRRKAAAQIGTVIHKYEHAFIDAVDESKGLSVELVDFGPAMKGLIECVAERLTGWDLEQTRQYYRKIVDRAWTAASTMGELEHRTTAIDRNLDWLLMDERYSERFDRWEHAGYRYRPIWVRTASTSSGAGGLGSLGGKTGTSGIPAPTLGDVGASFAGWSENLAGKLTGSLSPAAVRGSSGVVNLGGADKATGEVLAAMFSGNGGGGGGGSSCACAGCACACACAGGGR